MLKVNINHLPDFINLCKESKNNILLVGNPGVGKSQVIESMASEDCKVTTMTGSSTIEEYVNGIPQVNPETNCLEYVSQKWFKDMQKYAEEHPDGMQILFLDEFNTADPQVLKTFLTILAERRIPTLNAKIPDNTVIVAAMNPNDQNDTERLIRPMASRFLVLEAVSTRQSYKDFIEGKETPSILNGLVDENENEIAEAVQCALVDQISDEEWNMYRESGDESYHEINPRSFTNFIRAMKHIKNPAKVCGQLSNAFLGRNLRWVEDSEELRRKRTEKIMNGSVFPTKEEMLEMRTEALKVLLQKVNSPSVKGPSARSCRLDLDEIISLRESGELPEPTENSEEKKFSILD